MIPRFYRLFALCMALLWVPVTAHCRMEAAGLEFAPCAAPCHDQAPANTDGCDVVEGGLYKNVTDPLKVAPSITMLCACFICLPVSEPDALSGPGIATPEGARPLEWVPTWSFARRAAAPAHAPDSLIA
jgi:hypothetical protein